MAAAFQAMVSAQYKIALMGLGVLLLFVMAGVIIYFSEKPRSK